MRISRSPRPAKEVSRWSCPRFPSSCEPPVAVVDKNVDRHGTRALATAYLEYLYSPGGPGRDRPQFLPAASAAAKAKYAHQFPALNLVTVETAFGGWSKAQPEFFGDGGIFDQVYAQGG